MRCGVVALCQAADELQVICARHKLTECVISPASHTSMLFTHNSPIFILLTQQALALFKPLCEIRSEGVN